MQLVVLAGALFGAGSPCPGFLSPGDLPTVSLGIGPARVGHPGTGGPAREKGSRLGCSPLSAALGSLCPEAGTGSGGLVAGAWLGAGGLVAGAGVGALSGAAGILGTDGTALAGDAAALGAGATTLAAGRGPLGRAGEALTGGLAACSKP